MNGRRRLSALAAVVLLVTTACGLGSGSAVPLQVGPGSITPTPGLEGVQITVGSKEYTEQVILGYILEYTLAAAGARVRDRDKGHQVGALVLGLIHKRPDPPSVVEHAPQTLQVQKRGRNHRRHGRYGFEDDDTVAIPAAEQRTGGGGQSANRAQGQAIG